MLMTTMNRFNEVIHYTCMLKIYHKIFTEYFGYDDTIQLNLINGALVIRCVKDKSFYLDLLIIWCVIKTVKIPINLASSSLHIFWKLIKSGLY